MMGAILFGVEKLQTSLQHNGNYKTNLVKEELFT
jgi:hypothetical protein